MSVVTFHYKEKDCMKNLSNSLKSRIDKDTIIVCIGTDRATGDALGPLVGHKLVKSGFPLCVYGTLDETVNAKNVKDIYEEIKLKHPGRKILAIDASLTPLSDESKIGNINIKDTPLSPGAGVGKKIVEIGDASITGVVNSGGSSGFEYLAVQATRLSIVENMAEIIAQSIISATKIESFKEGENIWIRILNNVSMKLKSIRKWLPSILKK